MKRILFVVVLLAWPRPAAAQLFGGIVFDPAHLGKLVQQAKQLYDTYRIVNAQRAKLEEMSVVLPQMERYRIKPVEIVRHQVAAFPHAAPVLQALNAGDARGALLEQVLAPLRPLAPELISKLPLYAQRAVMNYYASVEIADSILPRAIHQRGAVSVFMSDIAQAVQELENDVTRQGTKYGRLTAQLDKQSAAALLDVRQNLADNSISSHLLEQEIYRAKQTRDAEAETLNMRLTEMEQGAAESDKLMRWTTNALRTWRMP